MKLLFPNGLAALVTDLIYAGVFTLAFWGLTALLHQSVDLGLVFVVYFVARDGGRSAGRRQKK